MGLHRPSSSPSFTHMPILSQICALLRGKSSVDIGHPPPQPPHYLSASPQFEVESPPTPDLDDRNAPFPQRHGQAAQNLRSSLPSTCRWLGPEDINLVGEHPIAAGGFADIYEATHNGCKVVLKSYRCYESFDIASVVAVPCNHSLYRVHYSRLPSRGFKARLTYGPSFIAELERQYNS